MSLIKIINGVLKDSVSFRKNVSAVELIISKAGKVGIDLTTPVVECYISNTKKTNRLKFFPRVRVIDLVELNTELKERVIYLSGQLSLTSTVVDPMSGPIVIGAPINIVATRVINKATVQIDLTDGANGVEISGDDDIILELDGLDAGTTYELRAIEEQDKVSIEGHPMLAYQYEVLSTKQEQNARFDVTGVNRFAIDRSAAFDSIELGFKDGSNKKLSLEDIDQQARDTFGRVYLTNMELPVGDGEMIQVINEELVPRQNCIIPVSSDMLFMQVNSRPVGGAFVSVRVIAQKEQAI